MEILLRINEECPFQDMIPFKLLVFPLQLIGSEDFNGNRDIEDSFCFMYYE